MSSESIVGTTSKRQPVFDALAVINYYAPCSTAFRLRDIPAGNIRQHQADLVRNTSRTRSVRRRASCSTRRKRFSPACPSRARMFADLEVQGSGRLRKQQLAIHTHVLGHARNFQSLKRTRLGTGGETRDNDLSSPWDWPAV